MILNCSNRGNLGQWISTFGRTIDGGGAGGYSAANIPTGSGGGQNTGTSSPNTESLGSATPINITPSYIIVKIWKRLT